MAAADHLQVPRQHGLFQHHGIDLGDGTVAHYLEGRQILRSPRHDFSRGEPISVVPYDAGSCSPAGTTLRRAMGRLERLRQTLLEQLETALTRVEARWGQQQLEAVRLAAQKLADQLSEVEELEARLEHLLDPGSGP